MRGTAYLDARAGKSDLTGRILERSQCICTDFHFFPRKIREVIMVSRRNNSERDDSLPKDSHLVFLSDEDEELIRVRPVRSSKKYESARKVTRDPKLLARFGALASAAPAGAIALQSKGRQLMEVVVNGDLIRAHDGNGFRAIAMGKDGIKEHARLFKPKDLTNLINAAAVWQAASVVVAQKHLADISDKLNLIVKGVNGLHARADDERLSRIEASAVYLAEMKGFIEEGKVLPEQRIEFESCWRDLMGLEKDLLKDIRWELNTEVEHSEKFGTEDLTRDIAAKISSVERKMMDLLLCLATKIAAWHVFSLFVGSGSQSDRRKDAAYKLLEEFAPLVDEIEAKFLREIDRVRSIWDCREFRV